jgi:hypothetical protein
MNKIKLIFFKGFLKTETMLNNGWFDIWFKDVNIIEKKGYEVIVFKIPAEMRHELIEKIEILIQKETNFIH